MFEMLQKLPKILLTRFFSFPLGLDLVLQRLKGVRKTSQNQQNSIVMWEKSSEKVTALSVFLCVAAASLIDR